MRTVVIGLLATALLLPPTVQADYKTYNMTMLYGQDVALKHYHDITIRARCLRLNGGAQPSAQNSDDSMAGQDVLFIYAAAENPALLRGHDNYLGDGSYLTHNTAPQFSRLTELSAPAGVERFDNGINGGWAIGLFDRRGISLDSDKTALAVNPFGHEGCYLSVMLDKITGPKRAKGGFFEEDGDEN